MQRLALLISLGLLGMPLQAQDSNDLIDPVRAQQNYMLRCQGCHLADGSGLGEIVPDLRGWPGRIAKVEGGRDYLVQVPGSANAPLSDAELAEVLNWMLVTMSPDTLATDFKAYSAEEVGKARQHPLGAKLVEVRQALIKQLEDY